MASTAPHPGTTLFEEYLGPARISQYRLAVDIGVPPRRINEIVHGKRAITGDTALRLERYFGVPAEFWLNLQAKYDLDRERARLGNRLMEEVAVRGRAPGSAPVETRKQVIDRLLARADAIQQLGIARLALFGSFARDEADADSDVDLLVEFEPGAKNYERYVALAELCEEALGRTVELVSADALSPFIGPYILAEARDVVRAA